MLAFRINNSVYFTLYNFTRSNLEKLITYILVVLKIQNNEKIKKKRWQNKNR